MIYLLIKEHNQEYSLYNLIKAFFPDDEIKTIKSKVEYLENGILIESYLKEKNKELFVTTNLYINGKLFISKREDVETVKIKGESKDKRISIAIRKSMYSILNETSKLDSPWGILTGVRPIKIVNDLINKDIPKTEIQDILKREYKINTNKIELMMNIVEIQREYIYPIKDQYSLYISIPFCPSKCYYCSFPSLSIGGYIGQIEEYVEKLICEINRTKEMMEGRDINTVYIGGGTPTAIPSKYLERIIQAVYSNFGKENIAEFTVEAGRPDTINKDYLEVLKDNDIKRISINPQTMNDKTLQRIGRKHTGKDIINTYKMAKKLGFDSINMDLIIGLPGEDEKDFKNTIFEISKLNPDNLTVHTLSLKTGSYLRENPIDYSVKSQNSLRNMLNLSLKYAEDIGLYPYYLYRQKRILGNLENIGFAKKDKECIYNIVMMEEKQTIIGVGMGAVSKIYDKKRDKIKRVPNFKSLNEYLKRVDDSNLKKQRAIENTS